MRKFKMICKDERGLAVVEAAILLPVCILMIVAVYYASIFMCQKANLQANLQNALVYYKNVDSDTYVEAKTGMAYNRADTGVSAVGGGLSTPAPLFPYRFFSLQMNESGFTSFFRSMCGYMFFDTGENVAVTVDTTNYVVYKTISATAVQKVKPAISLAMFGLPDAIELRAYGEVVITNSDDFIRNVDFVFDLLADTKLGEIAGQVVDKAASLYKSFKEKFG